MRSELSFKIIVRSISISIKEEHGWWCGVRTGLSGREWVSQTKMYTVFDSLRSSIDCGFGVPA